MFRIKSSLLVTALLFFTNVANSQTATQQLDSFFTQLAAKDMFNGAVLVAEKGKIVYQQAFGYADFATQKKNQTTTAFQLASVSKIFTAIAVLQLAERKKIRLNASFTFYFPQFPYPTITIRQLLSHSSGISDQELAQAANSVFPGLKRNYTNQELIPLLNEANIKFRLSPNEKWWYSNTGYILLAALVEKVSKQSFEKYLIKEIFTPAGMYNTYLKSDFLPARDSSNMANNYDYEFKYTVTRIKMEGERSYYNGASHGASNVISTLDDLHKFDLALIAGKLLKWPAQIDAYTPTRLENGEPNHVWLNIGGMGNAFDGLGWFTFEDTSMGKIVWHTGGMPGCATIMLRNIDKQQLVVVLDNTGSEGLYRNGLSALNILNKRAAVPGKRSLAKLYAKTLYSKGKDCAAVLLLENRMNDSEFNFSENELNNLGYEFLEQGLLEQALETFKLNTFLFPESDNVYNSYAEALLKAGNKPESILMYQRSVRLNPANEDSRKALQALEARE